MLNGLKINLTPPNNMNTLIQNKSISEVSEVLKIGSSYELIQSSDISFIASIYIGDCYLWCEFGWN